MTNEDIDLDAYFARIGYSGPTAPTLEVLHAIQERHTTTIPFENLSVLTGAPIKLDLASLQDKLIRRRRGGYCFEMNGLFAAALTALGFRVTPLAARVRLGAPETAVTPRSHMLLKVDIDDSAYVVDVGFGGLNPTAPLKLEYDVEQATALGTYRFLERDGAYEFQGKAGADFLPLHRFTLERQFQPDYEVANWYVSTHPASRFIQNLTVARPGVGRRTTLFNRELTIRYSDGRMEEKVLDGFDELAGALHRYFDLDLHDIAPDSGTKAAIERRLNQS